MNAHSNWPWSREDLIRLSDMRDDGMSWEEIASDLGRSASACKQAWRPFLGSESPPMQRETDQQAAMWSRLLGSQ